MAEETGTAGRLLHGSFYRVTGPELYTIAAHHGFASALARGLLDRHAGDGLALARGMILLPNARALRAVRDAFIRHAGEALLLPRLVALGEGALEDAAGGALDRMGANMVPPAIDPLHRRFLLAGMVRAKPAFADVPAAALLRLADGLAGMLDTLEMEEVPLAELEALLEQEAAPAAHWQIALEVMTQVAREWPARLQALGSVDLASRRNQLFDATSALWKRDGLPVPWLCAAGVTVSSPAVARLLRVIADSPGGYVVFPHLDLDMAEAQWASLGTDPRSAREDGAARPLETHPQYHLKLLLDRMSVAREEVKRWPAASEMPGDANRPQALRALLAPAAFTPVGPDLPAWLRRLPGVYALDCASPAEEALSIALAMREVLETPGRTAALVTPDRAIATRVAAQFARWGITVEDSAGEPLSQTPAGKLLLAALEAAVSSFAPVPLLALLNHPLAGGSLAERLGWLDGARALDKALRGPRPAAGLSGIAAHLADPRHSTARDWWTQRAEPLLRPLEQLQHAALPATIALLRNVLHDLAGEAVWTGAAGKALAQLFDQLAHYGPAWAGMIDPKDLPAFFRTLMADTAVRRQAGGHPRLFIWGLLEARLQRADRMILAGMNEGQWPQLPSPDAWLSAGFRRRLGLAGADRQIGLSTHDFATALAAPEVYLTRSSHDGSAPTVPSRLRLRVDALLGRANSLKAGPVDFVALARSLDAPVRSSAIVRPAPNPPVALRPQRISASALDELRADPFSWYAKHVLGLFPLDPVDGAPDARWQGTHVHSLLQQWLEEQSWDPDKLQQLAQQRLSQGDVNAVLRRVWGPRLCAALDWAARQMVQNRAEGRVPVLSATEQRGEMEIAGIRLSGKADRIDLLPDGSLVIVDYKTGVSPVPRAVAAGFGSQLGLLGLLASSGAIPGTGKAVSGYEYWRLRRKERGKFGYFAAPWASKGANAMTAEQFGQRTLEWLEEGASYLLTQRPFAAKLRPEYAPFTDYDQLMRLEEWYGALDEGGSSDATQGGRP